MRFDPRSLRKTVLDMAYAGASVHIGCAFSMIELFAVIYRNHLRFHVEDPDWPKRDFLVLSKGHGVMAQYACLREIGWIGQHDIDRYFSDGSGLKGLSECHVPGLEVTSGSLGHGLCVATGLALGAKLRVSDQRCFALVGDGEMNEGTMWEALLFAAHNKLDNLVVVVDQNDFQAMGTTDAVMNLGSLREKFTSFGFDVAMVDGHREAEIDDALTRLLMMSNSRPKAVLAKTIKGKGVSFMENDNRWHYTRLTPETYSLAVSELITEHRS